MTLLSSRARQLARALPGSSKTLVALEAAFTDTARVRGLLSANAVLVDGDYAVFDATAANRVATLPAPTAGAEVLVKLHATAGGHTLTVARSSGGVKIDNVAADLSTVVVGTVYRLVANGTDWFTVSVNVTTADVEAVIADLIARLAAAEATVAAHTVTIASHTAELSDHEARIVALETP